MRDLNPQTVYDALQELTRQHRSAGDELDKLEMELVNKREDYTLAYSTAFMKADGSIEARKHIATLATSVERVEADKTEALVRGKKRHIDTLRLRIDVTRTAGALVRAEMELAK